MKNLAYLEVFATVCRMRSFSKAADSLNAPKSTVSRKIRALETNLGVSLIKRDPRHFALTDEGEILLQSAESLLSQADEAFENVRNTESGLRGLINISTTADLSLLYLTKAAARFSLQNPEVKINIDVTPKLSDLVSERIDFAIRAGILKDSNLFAKKLHEQQPGFFASPEYISKNAGPKHLEDLAQHSIVGISKVNINGFSVVPTLQANNMSVIKNLTLNSAGIGLIAEQAVHEEKKSGKLVQVLTSIQLPRTPIFLIFPSKKIPKRVDALIKEIQKMKF